MCTGVRSIWAAEERQSSSNMGADTGLVHICVVKHTYVGTYLTYSALEFLWIFRVQPKNITLKIVVVHDNIFFVKVRERPSFL